MALLVCTVIYWVKSNKNKKAGPRVPVAVQKQNKTHTHTHARTHVRTHTHAHAHTQHTHTHTHTHTHINKQTNKQTKQKSIVFILYLSMVFFVKTKKREDAQSVLFCEGLIVSPSRRQAVQSYSPVVFVSTSSQVSYSSEIVHNNTYALMLQPTSGPNSSKHRRDRKL